MIGRVPACGTAKELNTLKTAVVASTLRNASCSGDDAFAAVDAVVPLIRGYHLRSLLATGRDEAHVWATRMLVGDSSMPDLLVGSSWILWLTFVTWVLRTMLRSRANNSRLLGGTTLAVQPLQVRELARLLIMSIVVWPLAIATITRLKLKARKYRELLSAWWAGEGASTWR
jgi:hypothetical protein